MGSNRPQPHGVPIENSAAALRRENETLSQQVKSLIKAEGALYAYQ